MRSAVFLAAAAFLVACQPEQPQEPPASPPPPVPAEAVLSPGGWGPIVMGMTHEAAVAALHGRVIQDSTTADVDRMACHFIRPVAPAGVWIMVEQDRVTRVGLEDSPVATDTGVKVGDPEAKVRAAYPQGLVETPHKYRAAPAKYLTWYGGPGGHGMRYSIGEDGAVHSISGGTRSIEYVEGCA